MEREPQIRLLTFGIILLVMLIWEALSSRRAPRESRWLHGARNLLLAVVDSLLVRLLLPIVPAGFAVLAAEWKWGLLHVVAVPGWAAVVLSIIAFDFAIYLQHVLFHAVPALWRLHMVHHSDLDFDTTTGLRFHPVEILVSLGIKLGLVALVGPPVLAVMLFEILLNGTSLFNHGNVRLPGGMDRWLRWILVTPDMHRVHHSIERSETNSNFGFNLPWWDRLLGTYREQPAAGHDEMVIGLEHLRDPKSVTLGKLLVMPFRGQEGGYAIGGRRPRGSDGRGGAREPLGSGEVANAVQNVGVEQGNGPSGKP